MLSHKNPYEYLIFPRIHVVFVTIIAHPTTISDSGLQSLDNVVLDRSRNTAFSKRTVATPHYFKRNRVTVTRFLSIPSDIPPRQFQPQVVHGLFLGLFSTALCQVEVYRRADQGMLLTVRETIAV